MLEVTMTPDEAEEWCNPRSGVCPNSEDPGFDWDCGSPECVMCCEAHKQGRNVTEERNPS